MEQSKEIVSEEAIDSDSVVESSPQQFPPPPSPEIDRGEEFIIVYNLPDFDLLSEEVVHYFNAKIGLVQSFEAFLNNSDDTVNIRITFLKSTDARKAFVVLNNTMLFGRKIVIKIFADQSKVDIMQVLEEVIQIETTSLDLLSAKDYVLLSNLPGTSTAQSLLEHFQTLVGPMHSVGLELDELGFYNGKAKLVFCDPSDARKVLPVNVSLFNGCPIKMMVINDGNISDVTLQLQPAPPGVMEPKEEHIIVSNLPQSMRACEIVAFFQDNVGLVKSCGFVVDSMEDNNQQVLTGRVRIAFCIPENARFALKALNHHVIHGQQLEIQLFIDGDIVHPEQVIMYPPESSNVHLQHVHICNLPLSATGAQIIDHFKNLVGAVESVGLELGHDGLYNGNAKLTFHHLPDAHKALVYHNSLFHGNLIQMTMFIDNNQQPAILPAEQPSDDHRVITATESVPLNDDALETRHRSHSMTTNDPSAI